MHSLTHTYVYAGCPVHSLIYTYVYAGCPVHDLIHTWVYAGCPMHSLFHTYVYAGCPVHDLIPEVILKQKCDELADLKFYRLNITWSVVHVDVLMESQQRH